MNTSALTASPAIRARTGAFILNRRFAINYASTLAAIGLAFWIVTDLSNFHRSFLRAEWTFTALGVDRTIAIRDVLVGVMAAYAILLVPYYAANPWLRSKSSIFLRGLWFMVLRQRRAPRATPSGHRLRLPLAHPLSPLARQAGLALLLKFFFAPLMLNWCLGHISDVCATLLQLFRTADDGMPLRMLFDTSLFWASFQLILFVDTLLFTLGYLIEMPSLNNRIRSVDPTFFGWFVCLACYPPFNDFTLRFLEWQSADSPQFGNDVVHIAINVMILVALAIFSWASIALGWKASNLTNRGIVTHGPYRYVRHPAYAAKNLAWWLGAMPTLGMMLAIGSWRSVAYCLVALCGWTALYALRALTEERHLLMIDNGYERYMKDVRWRFVPGLW